MYPNTNYIRASDLAAIFTTNINSIYVFGTASNSVDSGPQKQYWTGFSTSSPWLIAGGDCSNWSSNTGTGRGAVSDVTDYGMIRSLNLSCNSSLYLLCVEQ